MSFDITGSAWTRAARSEFEQHVAVGFDGRGLERVHHDRGVGHLDDRRPGHDVAGHEALAPEQWRLVEITELRPVDRTRTGPGLARRFTVALGRGDDAGLG